ENDNLFNTTLLLDPKGKIIAKYRKIHLFGFQSQEDSILKRGEEITVANTPWGKAGLSTCYDLRFPELYRKMVDKGAKFFLVASAWPHMRLDAWILFNRVRAHENLACLFSCNCAGTNNGKKYAGNSLFVDAMGKIIAQATEEENVLSAELDLTQVDTVRKNFSALDDRIFK
ncbi:unnamed protein product, partial [marine sediment metagenome]